MSDLATLHKVAKGNPGAFRVCIEIMQSGRDDLLKTLDGLGIRGPALWMAYKDFGDETVGTLIRRLDDDREALLESLRGTGYLQEEPRPKQGSIEVTQYLMPNGRQRMVTLPMDADLADRARAAGLVLSCEVLQTGTVALYVRRPDADEEDEDCGLAHNGPGEDAPAVVLERMVRKALEAAKP